jgi:nitrogen fixation NifU-like protein
MYDLQELYQEIVMDHNRRPRNFHELKDATQSAEGFNPLCGDEVKVYLKVEDDVISDVGIVAAGCAISKASASMMSESVKGKSVEEAEHVFNAFRHMITHPSEDYDADTLGDLEILSGVARYPARIKCAVLSWHTLESALENKEGSVSTE